MQHQGHDVLTVFDGASSTDPARVWSGRLETLPLPDIVFTSSGASLYLHLHSDYSVQVRLPPPPLVV
jgi:hypothetical protein